MDRYAAFANSSVGRRVVRRAGLPRPARLRRYAQGQPDVDGPVLVGGLRGPQGEAPRAGLAGGAGSAADLVRSILPAETTDKAEGYRGLVYDATALDDVGALRELHGFFQPALADLLPHGRVAVLGTPPALARGVRAAAAQRALDGFVRSVGKELTRGGTANLLYVEPDCGDALASPLRFLLSARSAYVSGQAITVGPAPAPHDAGPLVAAVTGAARGIGAAIVRVLARSGVTVVGIDVPAAGDALADVVNDVRGSALQVDLAHVDAPQRIVRHFTERHGRLDILVHNAGITRDRTLARMSAQEWDAVLAVNLGAPLAVNDAVLASDLMGAGGRIVAVSSVSGIAGNRGQTNYAASKAGVIGMVRALAPAVRERGITVNGVAPGFIETAMTASVPAATRAVGRRLNSLGQAGLPVDVAEAVGWLAEPGAAGVTGTVLRVCGQSLIGA
jgi:3-oxoacyl-[acyl-carrier protein] reductase